MRRGPGGRGRSTRDEEERAAAAAVRVERGEEDAPVRPASLSRRAAWSPARPAPMTTQSYTASDPVEDDMATRRRCETRGRRGGE